MNSNYHSQALLVESSQQEDDASPTPAVPLIAIQQPTPIIRGSKRKATPDKSTGMCLLKERKKTPYKRTHCGCTRFCRMKLSFSDVQLDWFPFI